ncbi:MAG TPA: sulfide/dihydroorotate dehydrogenase-like FAD/NAD-binding protein [Candidatus Acidoferrum sp.]|nr:sulfide/dihydroorotate dehydrogenase-like FAD/NAD-binding protein [Candidatus Acidoferrum sp.]
MYRILEAQFIAPGIKRFVIDVPRIAKKHQAGQFVILRLHERGERIPITIESSDREKGTIRIVVQAVGKTTYELNEMETGQTILDVVGPLGKPSEIEKYGTVAVLGGGVGTALAYPTTAALKEAGNRILTILGGRSRELVLLEKEMREVSDALYVTTDDGSYGEKGLVTDKLRELIGAGELIQLVLAVGPVPMMKAVAELTREHGIKTIVSLNPIMIDGTGMCGGCRVLVGGKSQFACVDGPEFDAHQVDFGVLMQRNRMYRDAEKESLERFQRACEGDGENGGKCRSGVAETAPVVIAGGKP